MAKTIGIDPGLRGAIAINSDEIKVFDIPIYKTSKGKDDYDLPSIVKIFAPYTGKGYLVALELVHSMPGQGVSSSFNFGRGRGILEGIIVALGFKLVLVTPQAWKKPWPSLMAVHPPRNKDCKPKTANEKIEIARDKRLSKAAVKVKARELAGKIYPSLKDQFKKVNSDGRAEAVLISHYASLFLKESIDD